jgi:hypothetical protein
MVGIAPLRSEDRLQAPRRNPQIDRLSHALQTRQTKTLAAGIDMIMADLRESMTAKPEPMDHHAYALVFLVAYRRDPRSGETGCDWVQDAQAERAALLGAETATVLANYIRVLGHSARAHSATTCDVDLARLAVKAGLAQVAGDQITHPWLKQRFGLAAVTTDMALAPDLPLAADQPKSVRMGLDWGLGRHGGASRGSHDPYARRDYAQGAHPFETLKRVETPTTYIDEPNVARVPKRTDMFARAQFGDMGPALQKGATAGHYVRKAAPSSAQRRLLGAFVLLQDGEPAAHAQPIAPNWRPITSKGPAIFSA